MKNRVVDGVEVWKRFEDMLISGLRFSIGWCARGAGLSTFSVRKAVRQLATKGASRLAERSKRGHVIEVRLPAEVRGVGQKERRGRSGALARRGGEPGGNRLSGKAGAAGGDSRARGRALLLLFAASDGDNAMPRSHRSAGADGTEWLSEPGFELLGMQFTERGSAGGDFLRWLYREARLESGELKERLGALEKMAAGKMRPEWLGRSDTRGEVEEVKEIEEVKEVKETEGGLSPGWGLWERADSSQLTADRKRAEGAGGSRPA